MPRLVSKKAWGGNLFDGSLTQNSYSSLMPLNQGSSTLKDLGLSVSLGKGNNTTNMLLNAGSKNGDPLAMKILSDTNSKTAIKNLGGLSSSNPSSSNPSKSSFMDGLKGFASGAGGQMAGQGLSILNNIIPSADKEVNSNDALAGGLRSSGEQALLTSGNPYAMAAGAGLMAIDKLGGFSDASKGLGGTTDTLNMAASVLVPGSGFFTGKTEKYKQSDELKSSSSYTGTSKQAGIAEQNAGAKLLFGKGKANRMIQTAKRNDNVIQGILQNGTDIKSSAMNPMTATRNLIDLNGGYQNVAIGKIGMKLNLDKDFASRALKFQQGGTISKFTFDQFLEKIGKQDYDTTQKDYDLKAYYDRAHGDGDTEEDQAIKDNYQRLIKWDGEGERPHMLDTFKKPNHMTFSNKSIYSTDETPGGEWEGDDENGWTFTPSDYNIKQHPYNEMLDYFLEYEPNSALHYKNQIKTPEVEVTPEKFEEGGKVNVIPDGALHARKHHLDEVDEKLKDVTAKGIPVITEEKGGEITQQAEVEINEIIFHLEATNQFEKLAKDGSDDAAVELGKILVKEILENTVDNTGLLEEIE